MWNNIHFCVLLLGLRIGLQITLFMYRPMCVLEILYTPVFNLCITLQDLADIGLKLNVSAHNPGLVSD